MQSYFPENSNQPPSEAKVEIWLQWDDFVGAIQSYDKAAGALIDAAETQNPSAMVGAFKEIMRSCKSCHQRFRED